VSDTIIPPYSITRVDKVIALFTMRHFRPFST